MSDNNNNNEAKKEKLAEDIIRLARNSLVVNLRFMDSAVSLMKVEPYEGAIATDGEKMYYDPTYILRAYKTAKEYPVRFYLHMLLHCTFRHWYINSLVNHECWDLACDIAVESIINELDLSQTRISTQSRQQTFIEHLKSQIKFLTAEKIYHYFIEENVSREDMKQLRVLFAADEHELWYAPLKTSGAGGDGDEEGENNGNNSGLAGGGEGDEGDSNSSVSMLQLSREQLAQNWKDIAEKLQVDLETFSKMQGDKAGSFMQNLKELNREKYDYTEFLKKFSVMGEAMKINNDEFDYIFYTYGMQLYDDMPLIEPLEYKEVKRIKEFVIAIDTSGSVQGDLVQRFVQKTYNILKQQESFFTKINIHIIQCDAAIQEDVKITCQEEFDKYIKNMTLKGFGGTDFRPVFSYVDSLINIKEFTNLKGLIYFTDGYGEFPKRQPDYNTAFVFIDDEYNNPNVPVWAIKLVLRKDEI